MQVRNLSNAASLLSGNAGSIVTRLQSASAYANQAASLGNIAGQFTTWQQTIGNSVNTLGKTLGLQQNQQASDAALLASLEQHSQSAQGQMQAIQAGNELAHATAVQLQQIQATLGCDGADAGDRDGGRRRPASVAGRRDAAFRAAAVVRRPPATSNGEDRDDDPESKRRRGNPRWRHSGHGRRYLRRHKGQHECLGELPGSDGCSPTCNPA